MTADEFRLLALSLPQVRYATQLGAVNFMVGDKVFATLGGPNPGLATVKLTVEDQAKAMAASSSTFFPYPGGAGARGVTCVRLAHAAPDLVLPILAKARAKAGRRATTTLSPNRR